MRFIQQNIFRRISDYTFYAATRAAPRGSTIARGVTEDVRRPEKFKTKRAHCVLTANDGVLVWPKVNL